MRWLLLLAGLLSLAPGTALLLWVSGVFSAPKSGASGIKERFDELEFIVIHRPHLTYFVDLKYRLCFATRKPAYEGLSEFQCPDYLLLEAEHGEQKKEKKQKEKPQEQQEQQG